MVVNKTSQLRLRLSAGLVLIWLAGSAFGFWWFQFKDLQAFSSATTVNKSIFFDGEKIQDDIQQLLPEFNVSNSADDKSTVVVHFWDPDCGCSRFNEQHVRQLMTEYRKRGIRFVIAARQGAFDSKAALQTKATQVFGKVDVVWSQGLAINKIIPSSPAAMVLDRQQKLAYFGPYSEGAVCSVGGGRFVERILDRVLQNDNPQYINTLAYGCFCDWQTKAKQI